MLVIYIDTTERKNILDKLKKNEEKYRNLFENMPGAYYRTNREGNLIMINPEGAKLFGYNSLKNILGKNIAQHLYFAPEERKKYLKELEKNKGNLKDFELTLKKKDGSPLVISDTSHFYYDKDENIAGVEGIFVDMGTISMIGGYQEKQFKAYMIAQIVEKYIDVLKEADISNVQALSMFPKNTFFYLGGVLPLTWGEIKKDYISEDLQLDLEKNIKQVQEKSGVDIEKTIYSWLAKEFSLGLFDTSVIFPKVGLIAGYSSEEKLIQNLYPALENFAPTMGGALVDNQYEGINYKSLPNPM
ncbi:unnamed protein product, partial [marine sediment metagenome]